MSTKEDAELEQTGFKQVRAAIPDKLWILFTEVGSDMGTSPKWVFNWLIKKIYRMTVNGQAGVFGEEFSEARRRLDSKGEFGVDPVNAPIDLMKLHRSDKLKSGLVGVYANGKGFRAVGRNPGTNTLMHIGTFPNADEAAWARYQHYQKYNLPYGDYAERLERLAKIYADHTEAQVKAIAEAEIASEKRKLPPKVF